MRMLGHVPDGLTPISIREEAKQHDARWTAREVIQRHTSSWEYDDIEKPKKVEEGKEAPENPNCYSDGSLKNPVGNHWAIGGLGLWWPERKEECEPLNDKERTYMDHEWKYGGCMQWASFNELRNSSTRCEMGGARMAMQKDGPVHAGIDNQATVLSVTEITEHQNIRKETKLVNEKGGLIVGGGKHNPIPQAIAKQKAMVIG